MFDSGCLFPQGWHSSVRGFQRALWVILLPSLLLSSVGCAGKSTTIDGGESEMSNVTVKFLLTVPEKTEGSVYITGSLPEWGPWDPGMTPMNGSGETRSYEVVVPVGSKIEYKFTLGSWQEELQDENGYTSGNFVVEASEDQTVKHRAFSFGTASNRDADPDGVIKALSTQPDIWTERCPDFYETFLYPGGLSKAVIISMDDCSVQDIRFVEMLNRHRLKGSFHLNSGKLDQEYHVASNELRAIYSGHEVSCHTVNHPYLTTLTKDEIKAEVFEDQKTLTRLAGNPVRGLSYPFGAVDFETLDVLRELGIVYARTTAQDTDFTLPQDLLIWPGSGHQSEALSLTDRFLDTGNEKLRLLLIWGHTWELDGQAQPETNSWESMEKFCAKLENRPDVWSATFIEVADYLTALQELEFSEDGRQVTNKAKSSIWMRSSEGMGVIELKPGQSANI